jgi:uncharacterized protein (TIGR04255 family)
MDNNIRERKYEKPPLIEAVCEFHFSQDNPWDIAAPGLIYNKIKEQFPFRNSMKINTLNEMDVPQGKGLGIRVEDRIQFFQKDKKTLLQISPYLIAINVLEPYKHWDFFFTQIKNIFKEYCNITENVKIENIILRYINKIEIMQLSLKLDEYFNFYPILREELPSNFGNFSLSVHVPYEKGKDLLKLELSDFPSEKENEARFILDLTYFPNKKERGKIELNDAIDWIDMAHTNVIKAFEGCITQKTREIFNEVED